MSYFPLFCDLESQGVLIFGGGRAALIKIKALLPHGAKITVCAKESLPEIQDWIDTGQVEKLDLPCGFSWKDLESRNLSTRHPALAEWLEESIRQNLFVVSATGSRNMDETLHHICQLNHVLFNAVDQPEICDFIFPSVLHDGLLSVGISTSGASPSAAKYLKQLISQEIPDWLPEALTLLKKVRPKIISDISDEKVRKEIFEGMFDWCLSSQKVPNLDDLEHIIQGILTKNDFRHEYSLNSEDCGMKSSEPGKVYLAGAGCGSRDWLTVQANRLLHMCDVLVYDDLVARDILNLFKEDAHHQKIYVGKRQGKHSWRQEDINRLLVDLAKKGYKVLRLKGGDPFVFGRGMEEVLQLRKEGIEYEVIPGISSALAIPLRMEIPITHRQVSRGFMVVTASRAEGENARQKWESDLRSMAGFEGTIVILMGATKIAQIASALIAMGKDPDTPAAYISSPDISSSKMIGALLRDLACEVEIAGLETPGIIVIGPVVQLARHRTE